MSFGYFNSKKHHFQKSTSHSRELNSTNECSYSKKGVQRHFLSFLIPRDGYELFDHDVWGQETSDDSFQISKNKFHKRSTFSEQLLKIVEKIAKTIVFETKKLRFFANFSRFFNIFCWLHVDPTWNLVLKSWKGSSEACFSSISWSKTS